jgi:hypothetical protein
MRARDLLKLRFVEFCRTDVGQGDDRGDFTKLSQRQAYIRHRLKPSCRRLRVNRDWVNTQEKTDIEDQAPRHDRRRPNALVQYLPRARR